jgi:hypothetical protein
MTGRQPPRREVVTGVPRGASRGRRAAGAPTRAGSRDEEDVRALARAQLWTAIVAAGLLALTVGLLPLLLALVPPIAGARVAGVPIAWPLLGVLAYPLLYAIGRWYVAKAEANEAHRYGRCAGGTGGADPAAGAGGRGAAARRRDGTAR